MARKKYEKYEQNPNSLLNLDTKAFNSQTHEQHVAAGRKGGLASAEKKKLKRDMRELILDFLDMPLKSGDIDDDVKSLADSEGKNLTVAQAMLLAQVKKAITGDVKALEFLRDTAGLKPSEKKEVTATLVNSPLDGILNQLNGDDTQ